MKKSVWAVVSAIILTTAISLLVGKSVVLVAEEQMAVVDRPSLDPGQSRVAGTLGAGDQVEVLGCHDVKRYMVPEVRLKDGARGSVVVGRFRLLRSAPTFLDLPNGRVVFSC